MQQTSNHLISKLTWDTVFDSKMQGLALQERISDWSGFQMQQELIAVFDKFCPAEQTWKIPLLELDLGIINLDELETELPIKLRQQLNEKLLDLILYSHQRGNHIEIFDEKKSHVQLIRYFLWHGNMPWNYQVADGSVNQLLTLQLQNNKEELLAMLKELGLSSEQVRKRMAWQFNEPNMVKIIEAFEPNVNGQIMLFSNELTKIQQKETIVQAASTTDFKKNIWFWVLNYLLTERGTVFNRIQFMKSSIKQMAAHYNMQYHELFELIELAVTKLSRSLTLQPDFILTLLLLSKENKALQKKKIKPIEEEEDHWSLLAMLFRDQNLRQTAGKGAMFNDLVTALSKQDQLRFKTLVRSFGNKSDFWLPLINELSDLSLKMVFMAIKDSQSVILTESVLFLNRLMNGTKQQSERNQLWYKGLMFILEHQNTSFIETNFLQVLISVLAENKQLSTIALLDQLLVAEVPTSLKTLRHTSLYRVLVAVFMKEISKMPTLQFKKHLLKLMELFHLQVKDGIRDRKNFETLKNILTNYSKLHPKEFKDALKSTPYLHSLELIIPVSIGSNSNAMFNFQHANLLSPTTDQSKNWLEELRHQPKEFLEFAKREMIAEPQLMWLHDTIGFEELVKMMGSLHQSRQVMLDILLQFYRVLGIISVNGITSSDMQYLLFKKLTKAWTSGNWKLIAAENIWNELIWELCSKRAIAKTTFLSCMDAHKMMLPPLLQLALESLMAQDRFSKKQDQNMPLKTKLLKPSLLMKSEKQEVLRGGLSVRNAGLVLLNSYLIMLLTRLALIVDRKFCNNESQLAAVHYLQYLVTGLDSTEESLLPLNKLLCGIPLSQPIHAGIIISDADKELINGLVTAVIGHWPAIGSCSVDGFRGNWLVRDGLLTEKEDRWELSVDKRVYDILIHKSPFSFSIIRYPWMDKPLHVNWPY